VQTRPGPGGSHGRDDGNAASRCVLREAVVHGNDRLIFAQTWERECRLAIGLIGLGLKSGNRVAVLEGNLKEAADFFLGAGIANLVRVQTIRATTRTRICTWSSIPAAGP
jgi:non-ribosomal peptide synthetase component E (peptide arylation enzyme)